MVYLYSLIDPGTAAGIIAAQCVCEPMTQYLLDYKRRTNSTSKKTTGLVRIKEIFGAITTDKMKNPSMLIFLKEEYEENKVDLSNMFNFGKK